jgi:hypothetical protein
MMDLFCETSRKKVARANETPFTSTCYFFLTCLWPLKFPCKRIMCVSDKSKYVVSIVSHSIFRMHFNALITDLNLISTSIENNCEISFSSEGQSADD